MTSSVSGSSYKRMQQQLAKLKKNSVDLGQYPSIKVLIDECKSLKAELAKVKRDAERYRYFCKRFDAPFQRWELARRLGVPDSEFEPSLDFSIDVAIEKEKDND